MCTVEIPVVGGRDAVNDGRLGVNEGTWLCDKCCCWCCDCCCNASEPAEDGGGNTGRCERDCGCPKLNESVVCGCCDCPCCCCCCEGGGRLTFLDANCGILKDGVNPPVGAAVGWFVACGVNVDGGFGVKDNVETGRGTDPDDDVVVGLVVVDVEDD